MSIKRGYTVLSLLLFLEKGVATAKEIVTAAKTSIMDNFSRQVEHVHIIASLAILYDEVHRASKTHTVRN